MLALAVSAGRPSALLLEFSPLLPGQVQPVLGDPWVTDRSTVSMCDSSFWCSLNLA